MAVCEYVIFTIFFFVCIVLSFRPRKGYYNVSTRSKCLIGKTVIVTGGTSGIGLEIAKDFAKRGAKVIVACPFQEEGIYAETTIREESENEEIYFKLLNLESFNSVKDFALHIIETEKRLDILVNNAEIVPPNQVITEDGLHNCMQVNYFGHFLLTVLLLPLLNKTGNVLVPARIINRGSIMHRFGDLKYMTSNTTEHNRMQLSKIYSTSKLCLALFTKELNTKIGANIVVNTVDPGYLKRGLCLMDCGISGIIIRLKSLFCANDSFQYAQNAINVALLTSHINNGEEVRGKYFEDRQMKKPSSAATNYKLAMKVWEDSVKVVKLTEEELEECLRLE